MKTTECKITLPGGWEFIGSVLNGSFFLCKDEHQRLMVGRKNYGVAGEPVEFVLAQRSVVANQLRVSGFIE